MNNIQLNSALLEILLHIGTSFDLKEVTDEAITHYLRQLDLSGAILFQQTSSHYHIHTAKPKILNSNNKIMEICDEMLGSIETIKEQYFSKALPYIVAEEKSFYYIYALKHFGFLMLIRNYKPFNIETIKALRPLNDKFANSLIACQNIEKLRARDNQLLQQSRLAQMGEMISMIAHQWRQPLGTIASTVINIQAKMMMGKFDFKSQKSIDECHTFLYEKLGNIDSYVQGLSTTIDDFRNFYNPNKQLREISINEPIEKSLNIIKASMTSSGITLEEKYDSHEKIFMADGEIMQVFLNILKNAQDNFKEKEIKNPFMRIETKDVPGGVQVNFYDNGGGIAEDVLPRIFDPYYSTKDQKNGTGLGLYMSKIIIEEHHYGTLDVENSDEGVCFSVTLYKEGVSSPDAFFA